MAKIGSLPHHASKSMGSHAPGFSGASDKPFVHGEVPSLIEAAHTPPAVPQRSSVTDSDATRVDTAKSAEAAPMDYSRDHSISDAEVMIEDFTGIKFGQ